MLCLVKIVYSVFIKKNVCYMFIIICLLFIIYIVHNCVLCFYYKDVIAYPVFIINK